MHGGSGTSQSFGKMTYHTIDIISIFDYNSTSNEGIESPIGKINNSIDIQLAAIKALTHCPPVCLLFLGSLAGIRTHAIRHPESHGIAHLRCSCLRWDKDSLVSKRLDAGHLNTAHLHFPSELVIDSLICLCPDADSLCICLCRQTGSLSLSFGLNPDSLCLCFGSGDGGIGSSI
jgi:hypothetical protein